MWLHNLTFPQEMVRVPISISHIVPFGMVAAEIEQYIITSPEIFYLDYWPHFLGPGPVSSVSTRPSPISKS